MTHQQTSGKFCEVSIDNQLSILLCDCHDDDDKNDDNQDYQ